MSQAGSIKTSSSSSGVLTLEGNSGGVVSPDGSGNIQVLGTGGVTVVGSGTGHKLTISSNNAFNVIVVTSASNPITLVPSTMYITTGGSTIDFVLPTGASSSLGDAYWIVGYGTQWQVAQNVSQTIQIGLLTSTAGVGGRISSTNGFDCILLVFGASTGGTIFAASGALQGNITVV